MNLLFIADKNTEVLYPFKILEVCLGADMSLEIDNINEPNEETKEQELEQFGVWVKKSPQENQNDNSDDFAGAEKTDVSTGFDDTFEIPSAVSSADGFESASFSDLSDFDIDNKSFSGDASGKNEDEDWNLDLDDFDIPDPPELSESDFQEKNDQLPLESAMNEAPVDASAPDTFEDSIPQTADETDNFEPAFDTTAEPVVSDSFEQAESVTASEFTEPSADSSSADSSGELVLVPLYPKNIFYFGNSLLRGSGFGMAASDNEHDYFYLINSQNNISEA